MGGANVAHQGSPTKDGGVVLTGSTNTLVGGMPAVRQGDLALLINKPPAAVVSGSKTVVVNGMPLASSHHQAAPAPSKSGTGVPGILTPEMWAQVKRAIEELQKHKGQAKTIRITNDAKNRMPGDVAKEDGQAIGKWGVEAKDFDGDGVVDKVTVQGGLAEVNSGDALVKNIGQGGIGANFDAKLGFAQVDYQGNPLGGVGVAVSGETGVEQVSLGGFIQDANNPNTWASIKVTGDFLHASGSASYQIGLTGASGGAIGAADFAAANVEIAASRPLFDLMNLGPVGGFVSSVGGQSLVDNGVKGAIGALKYFGFKGTAANLEAASKMTVQASVQAGVSAGAGAGAAGKAIYNPETKRFEVSGEGEVEWGPGIGVKVSVSVGQPTDSPIKPKAPAGGVDIAQGVFTIYVGDGK